LAFTPCWRATAATETPGASVCATIANFSSTARIRRGALPTAIDVSI
jgi:hypothetical protein